MVSQPPVPRPSARERLLQASDELFYTKGVHSTGVDAVLERAGVARGSLYYNFGGKDELVSEYLQGRSEKWAARIAEAVAGVEGPGERILAVFAAIVDHVGSAGYRGCPFALATAEADKGGAADKAARRYRRWLRKLFTGLVADTGVADSELLTDQLIVLYDGAMTTAAMDKARPAALTARGMAVVVLQTNGIEVRACT
jgi:AcrR family transcriptional regulator